MSIKGVAICQPKQNTKNDVLKEHYLNIYGISESISLAWKDVNICWSIYILTASTKHLEKSWIWSRDFVIQIEKGFILGRKLGSLEMGQREPIRFGSNETMKDPRGRKIASLKAGHLPPRGAKPLRYSENIALIWELIGNPFWSFSAWQREQTIRLCIASNRIWVRNKRTTRKSVAKNQLIFCTCPALNVISLYLHDSHFLMLL